MKQNDYTVAVIISLLLHGLLIAALLWGADFSMDKPKTAGNTIKAVVVDPALVNQQAKQIRQQREAAKKAEQDRLRRLEQQTQALEKERQAEERRLRELKSEKLKAEKAAREAEVERKRVAAERAKAAEEKRKADEAAKVAREQAAKAEAERKLKQEAARKAEAERQRQVAEQRKAEEAKRQAEEAKRKAEAEAKRAEEERQAKIAAKKKAEEEARKAEAARKEAERKAAEAREQQRQQEAALNDMFAGLEAETEQRGGVRGQFVDDETQRYGAIYTQMIQQNLLIEQSFVGKECVIRMRLSSNGLVLDASEAGGDRNVCRAAKAAVVKVSQFPMPEDPAVVERLRDIRLTVIPQ
ncbi:TolA [Photobacterium aquae]|uniref:TolA n=1 Tax=Photobacterium aquae TaxID=1195763 RepID=A0A0J1K3W2_9GAMM|nr:cell envelope integrity protein TolA [Photobacterium aquae]KLV09102.1 TolA [Photobacterium aquae]